MSKRSPIPTLPPIGGIKDDATRSYLESLTNAWLVRNGHTRDVEERFVTVKDLKLGFDLAKRGGGGLLTPADTGSTEFLVPGVISAYIQNLLDSVQTWRIWRLLGERIERMEMPEWFRGRFGAEIRTEQIRQENATSAMASQVTTAVSNINNNIAIARREITVVSDTASAAASAVTTLQTAVGDTTALAQQSFTLSQTALAVRGSWQVRFDINGYVTGFGLGVQTAPSGVPSSQFVIRADSFAFGSPATAGIDDLSDPALTNPNIPFVALSNTQTINGVVYPPGLYLKHTYIADATIDNARIANLAVTTLKIQDFAITATYSAEGSVASSWITANGTTTVQDYSDIVAYCASVNAASPVNAITIIATVIAECDTADTNVGVKFYRGGSVLATRTYSIRNGFTTTFTATCVVSAPSSGEVHLQLGYFNDWSSGRWRAKYESIVALMTKR